MPRPRLRLRPLAACALLAACLSPLAPAPGAALASTSSRSPTTRAALASTSSRSLTTTAGHVRYAIGAEGAWPNPALTAARSRVVILLPWQQALMHQLKAANPKLIVLEYKDLGNSSSYEAVNGFSTDGVSYAQAATAHPGWLLRNRAGRPIQCAGFAYLWAMNVGNRGFERAWANEVVHELNSQGWDGVFIDNVNPTIRYYADPADVAQYPSDGAYTAAMSAALKYIAPRIHAAGKLVMANIGSWPSYAATGLHWLRYLDGAMDERFTKFTPKTGAGYRSPAEWHIELSLLEQTQREHKWFLGIAQSSNGDVQAERFGWATTLLAARGRATFALQNDNEYGVETWFPDYEAPLGRALGRARRQPSGVYRRRFAHGLVLVNPTEQTHTVKLGARYSGDGLHDATKASMPPHTGLILTRRP